MKRGFDPRSRCSAFPTTRRERDQLLSVRYSKLLKRRAERFVRSIKEECLGRMIFFGESSLLRTIQEYVDHYHIERPHQGLGNRIIERARHLPTEGTEVRSSERLGGLLRHYSYAA